MLRRFSDFMQATLIKTKLSFPAGLKMPKSLYTQVVSVDITTMQRQKTKQASVLRFPRLDTILMVEKSIRAHDGELGKKALWEKLPKKMMYQTFCVIIDYLLYSGKISIDNEGKVGWIYNMELARKYYARIDLARRA